MGLLVKRLQSLLMLIPKLDNLEIKFWEYFMPQKKDLNALKVKTMKIKLPLKLIQKTMKKTAIRYLDFQV